MATQLLGQLSALPFSAQFSGFAAVVSLGLAIRIRRGQAGKPSVKAYFLVGSWALVPPVWFMVEWYLFTGNKEEFEYLKYSQELARNVWVALVIVLAKITGIAWPGKD
jgi:hypothetical protein